MIKLGPLGPSCIKCGGTPYSRGSKTYKMCAWCAWENIVSLLEVTEKTGTETIAVDRLVFLVGGEEIEE